MPGYILCQAQGGLNDIACQIWHCSQYAIQHQRSIILTKSAYFQTDLFDIFDFSDYPVPVYSLDKLKSITYDAVEPSCLEGYVQLFLNKEANMKEISKYMALGYYRFDKAVTFSPTTLLFHDSCGGGSESIQFFKHIKFTPYMINFFREKTKSFPSEYNALHIRNTDIKTNVYPLLQNINTNQLPLFIGTDDTSLKSYLLKTYCKTFSTAFKTNNTHNLHYVDEPHILEWAIVDLLSLVFSKNTMLSAYNQAGLTIESGYTRLIDGLKSNKEHFHSQIYPQDMAVLLTFFNPCNSKRILMNFLYTYSNLKTAGVPVYAIECLFPNQKPSIGFDDIRIVRSDSYFFYKEALLRLLEPTIPAQYTKLLFLDADLYYSEPNWYNEISHTLNSHEVVQPFKKLNYLDLTYKYVLHSRPSFASEIEKESAIGMAWAMTRDYYNRCGFFDYCLLGNGDTLSAVHFTGRGFTKESEKVLLKLHQETYKEHCKKPKPSSVGYCDLTINHLYHGSLKNRSYWNRNFLFDEIQEDVSNHLITNEYGLFEWKSQEMKQKWGKVIYKYFVDRKDDDMYEDINSDINVEIKYKPSYF